MKNFFRLIHPKKRPEIAKKENVEIYEEIDEAKKKSKKEKR